MSGPVNFLNRLQVELQKHDLPRYHIINPHPKNLPLLEDDNAVKVGRLDGAYYYKTTPLNLYNFIRQNKGVNLPLIKKIPYKLSMLLNKPFNDYLNRSNRMIMNRSNLLVFQSNLSKAMHTQFIGKQKLKNYVILNGVPTDVFRPILNMPRAKGSPALVITASFRLNKRLQDAILVVNSLQREIFPDIRLHIVGDLDSLTKSCIQNLDTSNCIFHGVVDSLKLPEIYNMCDVGLSPSLLDPCPNSVVEMVACGLPVITSSASGAAEIIKYSGLIVHEQIDLDYVELQTESRIPRVNVAMWCEAICNVLNDREAYVDMMLSRTKQELDIRITASKYAKIIREK